MLIRRYFKTYLASSYTFDVTLEDVKLEVIEPIVVPIVTVGKVGYDTAEISWESTLENFEVSYAPVVAEGETATEPTVVAVNGAKSCTLTGLDVKTTYSVKVRSIIAEGQYSDWSEAATFTTEDWPAVDAPELSYAIDEPTGNIVLSWTSTDEMLSYEVNVRPAASTEWTSYTTLTATTYTLEGLASETEYICRVRAFCTHDRTTGWSETVRFTTPTTDSIDEIATDIATGKAAIYDLQGRRVATPASGIYVVNGKKVLLNNK